MVVSFNDSPFTTLNLFLEQSGGQWGKDDDKKWGQEGGWGGNPWETQQGGNSWENPHESHNPHEQHHEGKPWESTWTGGDQHV